MKAPINLPKPKPLPESPPHWIVCAANQNENGRIVCGARHYDCHMRSQIESAEGHEEWHGCEQGFIDQYGNFYTREEAYIVAEQNGQIRRPLPGREGTLYSENLY